MYRADRKSTIEFHVCRETCILLNEVLLNRTFSILSLCAPGSRIVYARALEEEVRKKRRKMLSATLYRGGSENRNIAIFNRFCTPISIRFNYSIVGDARDGNDLSFRVCMCVHSRARAIAFLQKT